MCVEKENLNNGFNLNFLQAKHISLSKKYNCCVICGGNQYKGISEVNIS